MTQLEALNAIRQADLLSREMLQRHLHLREALQAAEEALENVLSTPTHEEGTASAIILGQISDRQSGSIENTRKNSLTSANGCGLPDSPGASASRGDRSESLSPHHQD